MQRKYSFFWGVLMGIILIVAFYTFSLRINHLMTENAQSRMVEIADNNALSVYAMFDRDIKFLEKAAGKWENIYDFSSEASMDNLYATFYYTNFMRMGLDSPDGRSYTSDGKIVNVSDMGYLDDVLNGKAVLTEVLNTKVENLPCFAVAVPIYRDQQVIGALRGVYLANSLADTIEMTTFEGEGYCNLIDAEGNYLFKSQKSLERYEEKNVFDVYRKATFQEGYEMERIREDLAAGKSNFSVYQADGEVRCVYYTPVGINDWYIFSSVPLDYLAKPTADIKLATLLLIGVLVIVSGIQILSTFLYNRKVRRRLTEERDYLGHILDSIPLPVFITSKQRRLQIVNNSSLELLGKEKHTVLGQPCSIWDTCICNTEDCSIERLVRTGNSNTIFSMNDRHYRVNSAVLGHGEDETSGFVEVIQDITEIIEIQKRLEANIQQMQKTEKELMITEERYRIATEITRDIIIDYDFSSHIMFHSIQATEIYGVEQQVAGAPHSLVDLGVVAEKCAEEYLEMFEKMSAGEPKASCVLLARAADGQDVWNRINFTTIFDGDHKPVRAIGILQDITREKEAELRYEREAHFRNLTVEDATLYYEVDLTEKRYLVGHEKTIAYLEEACNDYEVISKILLEHFVYPEDKEYVYANICWESLMKTYCSGERKSVIQYRRIMPEGNICWVECTYYLFKEKESGHICTICYIKDISTTKELELDLRQRAERDLLTGLYNKLTTEWKITEWIESVDEDGTGGVFFLIDLDNFKKINDTLGHDMGDFVLTETAHRLRSVFSAEDIVGRIGGDEFVAFLTQPETMEQVRLVAQRISECFHVPYSGCGNVTTVFASVGVSVFPEYGQTFQQLYKRADLALYQSKARGKNTFTIFKEE